MRTVALMALVGCNGSKESDEAADPQVDAEGDADTDADSDADADADTDVEPSAGLPVLGGGTHDPVNVVVTEVFTELDDPSDLQFHPEYPGQLWVTNRGNDSVAILEDAGGPAQSVSLRHHATSTHFLARPSGLAFGAPGWLATSHEEDRPTQGAEGTPADFMGPTLWSSDPDVFDGGDRSHGDMLHNSPNAAGIAWEVDNVYWVFDGYHASLTRYDFREPHELGGTDHTDGEIVRWVEGQVGYVEGCVSHLWFDPSSSLLYVADSGNARIATLDTTTGSRGGLYGPAYDGTGDQYYWDDAVLVPLVDEGLDMPAGIAQADGVLFVTDAATATIHAFDLTGAPIDYLPLGREPGGLQGIEVGADGSLWVVDAAANTVLRISAP